MRSSVVLRILLTVPSQGEEIPQELAEQDGAEAVRDVLCSLQTSSRSLVRVPQGNHGGAVNRRGGGMMEIDNAGAGAGAAGNANAVGADAGAGAGVAAAARAGGGRAARQQAPVIARDDVSWTLAQFVEGFVKSLYPGWHPRELQLLPPPADPVNAAGGEAVLAQ